MGKSIYRETCPVVVQIVKQGFDYFPGLKTKSFCGSDKKTFCNLDTYVAITELSKRSLCLAILVLFVVTTQNFGVFIKLL